MNWLASVVIGLLSAAAGAASSLVVAEYATRWHRVSDREGGRGYAVVALGLLGLVGGLAIGLVASRFFGRQGISGFARGAGAALGITVALVAAAGALSYATAEHPPEINGETLEIEIEVRCPPDFTPEATTAGASLTLYASNRKSSRTGSIEEAGATPIDGRRVFRGRVSLHSSGAGRLLAIDIPPARNEFHEVPLRGRPGAADLEWSDWFPKRPPGAASSSQFEYRFRVQPWQEPPSPQENQPEDTGPLSELAFKALRADSPLSEWLPHASYLAPEERRPAAMRAIASRPNLGTELAALIQSPDGEVSNLALRLVGDLPDVPVAVAEPVREVGQTILDALERFNGSKPEDDPAYQGAAAIGVRFAAWFQAVRALHERGGVDQRPQLAAVLKLATVRPDSRVLQGDVARIARFYTEKWAESPPSRQ